MTKAVTSGMAVHASGITFALTLVLPEPAGRSLEDMPASTREAGARRLLAADQHQHTEDPAPAA